MASQPRFEIECENCGKNAPHDAHYCPYCGEPMEDRSTISPFFMIEDKFSIKGRGTVVTGYLLWGNITVGDEVAIVHRDVDEISRVIIVGIEIDGKIVDTAEAGNSYGFLIRGSVNPSDINFGDLVYK